MGWVYNLSWFLVRFYVIVSDDEEDGEPETVSQKPIQKRHEEQISTFVQLVSSTSQL